jgi:hypothetical protein
MALQILNRRTFFKASLGGAALLGALRLAHGPFLEPPALTPLPVGAPLSALNPREEAVLAAIAPIMLGWSAPTPEPLGIMTFAPSQAERLARVVAGVDRAVAGLPQSVQAEVHDLFNLLAFAPARWLAGGLRKPWGEASADEISAFLQGWRLSKIGLLQAGYHALHELISAAWYGDLDNWKAVGYAPPKFAY